MNVTNLCLNVDIKVNLNYPDWGPTRFLLWIKTRILILDDFFKIKTFTAVITSIV